MTNLPEQAHQRGTSVAVRQDDDPYGLTARDVILPSLKIGQYSSDAFKRRSVAFGDLYVAIGRDDVNPVVVAKGGEPLGEALRFYIHRVQSGFNYREDPRDNRQTFGPVGSARQQSALFEAALAKTQGDPTRVFQKHVYHITTPAYEDLPVRFLMASLWGGPAAKWLNTQIGIIVQRGGNPLEFAFQVQSRPTKNDKGDFAVAAVGYADVKARDKGKDEELVQRHAALLSTANIAEDEAADAPPVADTSSAPSLG